MSWGSKFDEAARALEHAETYKPLPKHPELQVVARLWIYPSFTPWISWTVISTPIGLFVRRLVWPNVGQAFGILNLYGSEGLLPSERWEMCLSDLQEQNIVLGFKYGPGIDGIIYGFELISGLNTIRTTWWMEPPPGSEELALWHTRVTEEFQQYLPAMTDPYQM